LHNNSKNTIMSQSRQMTFTNRLYLLCLIFIFGVTVVQGCGTAVCGDRLSRLISQSCPCGVRTPNYKRFARSENDNNFSTFMTDMIGEHRRHKRDYPSIVEVCCQQKCCKLSTLQQLCKACEMD